MEAVARQLAAGTMLDDKYRIERLLAVGGMGAVYVGTHVKLRKKVVVWNRRVGAFDGGVDDLRWFSVALPSE